MGLTRAMVEHGPGSTRYREVLIPSADTHIVLSVWEADDTSAPVVVFVPGTMTHPLVYAESLNNLADRGTTVVGVHPVGHGNTTFNYPTMAEAYRVAALNGLNRLF